MVSSGSILLTAREVASLLRVHENTVYLWAKSGKLGALRVGGLWRIRKEDLDKFVNGKGINV